MNRRRKKREEQRRERGAKAHVPPRNLDFTNPYPWMSTAEAMVKIELEKHHVPFSWRYFDATDSAPMFTEMLVKGGYHPEFTLREYRLVVIVQGGFFGNLPGVIDNMALAQVTLEYDSWRVVILQEPDIRAYKTWKLLTEKVPELGTIAGAERPNPHGVPDLMVKNRERLKSQGVKRQIFRTKGKGDRPRHDRRNPNRISRIARRFGRHNRPSY